VSAQLTQIPDFDTCSGTVRSNPTPVSISLSSDSAYRTLLFPGASFQVNAGTPLVTADAFLSGLPAVTPTPRRLHMSKAHVINHCDLQWQLISVDRAAGCEQLSLRGH